VNNPGYEGVVIRPACVADYEAIAQVWRESGLGFSSAGRDRRDAFVQQLQQFPGSYLVAMKDDRVIGVVFGTHDGRKGWINRLAVVPEFRGRGIAARLVETCEMELERDGIEIIAALIEAGNNASGRVFEKMGYKTDVPVKYFRKLARPEAAGEHGECAC
jgi:N-acetylglutamate synthase